MILQLISVLFLRPVSFARVYAVEKDIASLFFLWVGSIRKGEFAWKFV